MIKLRYLAAWFVLLAVAMINGGLRDLTYGQYVSELLAHQISCMSGIVLFAVVIRQYVRLWPPVSAWEAWQIGFFWMILTVMFEFLFFHFVGGYSWEILLGNYDISAGRLWPLILLWVTISPWLFYRNAVRGRR